MNAEDHDKCKGCRHQKTDIKTQWCYMFKNPPEILPCAQHDRYALERKITGELIKKNPAFILGFILNR